MAQHYELSVRRQITDEYDPTKLLTTVLIINFMLILIMGLGSVYILFYAITQITTCSVHGINTVGWLLVGILPFLLTFFYLKLILSLQDYGNSARIILLVLASFIIALSIVFMSYLTLILALFIIYVLAFHKKTKKLFSS